MSYDGILICSNSMSYSRYMKALFIFSLFNRQGFLRNYSSQMAEIENTVFGGISNGNLLKSNVSRLTKLFK